MNNKICNDNNFNELIKKFKKINKERYIKGINNNLLNSCGLTFEKLLEKNADSTFFPDYKDIEIKCKQRYSKYDINLFSMAFTGPSLFETSYLLNKYGIADEIYKDKKKLIINLAYKKKILVNNKYYFELDFNYPNKRMLINIYDINFNLIEKRGFLYFKDLKERYDIKLKKLALVRASKKKIDGYLYFRYYSISCYYAKSFDRFLKMIKDKDIKVTLMLRFSRSEKNFGSNKNKGLLFIIKQDKIDKLFKQIYQFSN